MVTDTLGSVAMVRHMQGEHEVAERMATEGRSLAKEIDNPWGIGYNDMALAPLALDSGRFEVALSLVEECRINAERVRFPVFTGASRSAASRIYRELDDRTAAAQEAALAAEAFASVGAPAWTAEVPCERAFVALMSGNAREAWQNVADLVESLARGAPELQVIPFSFPVIAEAAYAAGENEKGFHFCNWLMAIAKEEKLARVMGELSLWRARLHFRVGTRAEALKDFVAAEDMLVRSNAPVVAWHAAAGVAQVHETTGDRAAATAARARSRRHILQVLDAAGDAQMREKFAARPDVSNILRA